ncbi:MAG: class I SAM-dependent methyltransferase, partial [Polyangiaceae bacterium]|nr:class I SAM-dependent methyltransferase [Polyangiaceae bacterium]
MKIPHALALTPALALAACAASPPAAPAPAPTGDEPAHHAHDAHDAHDAPGAPAAHHAHHGGANAHMNQASFEELVARFEDPERARWQKPEAVIAMLAPAGKTVADIGAGTGYFALRLAAAGADVLALDVDPRFVTYLEKRAAGDPAGARVHPKLIALDDPGLAPGSVDLVLLVDVYHHIEAREAYFRKLRPALRPGGELVIVDFKPGDLPA